ncbi:MAG: hypothetical protein MHMPM18_005119, partial [Marteilia pararefringens]
MECIKIHGCNILAKSGKNIKIQRAVRVNDLSISSCSINFSEHRFTNYFDLCDIRHLSLSNLAITDLKQTINWNLLRRLKTLDVSLNKISDVSALRAFSKIGFTLADLKLNNNKIEFNDEALKILSSIKSLKYLNIGSQEIGNKKREYLEL